MHGSEIIVILFYVYNNSMKIKHIEANKNKSAIYLFYKISQVSGTVKTIFLVNEK